MNLNLKKVGFFLILPLILIFKLIKISSILGYKSLAFSGVGIILPAISYYLGFLGILSVSSIFLFLKVFALFPAVTFGLPTAIASLSMSSFRSRYKFLPFSLNVIVPASCIILFAVFAPVFGFAKLYSLYWFIPMFAYYSLTHFNLSLIVNRFLQALSATFIAHAIGSTIWAFSVSMTSDQWISLIPLVAVERLVFASAITLTIYALQFLIRFICMKSIRANYFFLQTFKNLR